MSSRDPGLGFRQACSALELTSPGLASLIAVSLDSSADDSDVYLQRQDKDIVQFIFKDSGVQAFIDFALPPTGKSVVIKGITIVR